MAIKVLGDPWLGIAFILHLGTLAFTVASLAGRYWMDGITGHFGLWSYCFEHQTIANEQKCYNIEDVNAINVDGKSKILFIYSKVSRGIIPRRDTKP